MSSSRRAPTAQVEGEIVIRRPVEEVFDYVADERHEPNFNSRMSRVELLTPEPIGAGSRFGVEMTMMRRVFDMTVSSRPSSGRDCSVRPRARYHGEARGGRC